MIRTNSSEIKDYLYHLGPPTENPHSLNPSAVYLLKKLQVIKSAEVKYRKSVDSHNISKRLGTKVIEHK